MQLALKDELPFVCVTVSYQGTEIEVTDVLVDTGSATTILAADQVARIGIVPELADVLYTVRGVGGIETVFTRRVEHLRIGHREIAGFEIEVGGMDYGFEIQGILGMDFLTQAGAIINLHDLSLGFSS
ncbi:MAG: retropepsin-like aspartic protease [Anaerolineae bacterium]|jgi:predicted aspartyl protease